ncbi:MAG: hypothetical protein H3C34_19510 [Caldilineaceae bacterium]|nr:hypothetical protein [Caldilineaceae bacterium]
MVRQNRWTVRISFVAVLVMAMFGLWYATTIWFPALDTIDTSTMTDGADWIDIFSAVGEQAIQIFLGATSGR